MAQRNRRRQRRRGGIGGKLALLGGTLFVVLAFGAFAIASWVLNVAADAPSLAACKQDRPHRQLGHLRRRRQQAGADRLRRSARPGLDQTHPQAAAAGHRRDRGPALLRTRWRRSRGHPPRCGEEPRSWQDRRGRLDDHPAAGPQPLHPQPEARTSNARSSRRSWRSSTPNSTRASKSSTSTSTPPPTGRSKGATTVGVGAASQIYFSKPVWKLTRSNSPRCSPACPRRPPNTTRSSIPGSPATAQRGAGQDGPPRLPLPRARPPSRTSAASG